MSVKPREAGDREITHSSSKLLPVAKSSVTFYAFSTQFSAMEKMMAHMCLHGTKRE